MHIHTCKNNKANLVKGVGGEAARQKDINSLSEFNNRGGGGSRDKNEEVEKRREQEEEKEKGKKGRGQYNRLGEEKMYGKIRAFGEVNKTSMEQENSRSHCRRGEEWGRGCFTES